MRLWCLHACLCGVSACAFACSPFQKNTAASVVPPPAVSSPTVATPDSAHTAAVTPSVPEQNVTSSIREPGGMNAEDDEFNVLPVVLPGDHRAGLRTPQLPSTLIYAPDGKLNPQNTR